MRIRKPLTLIVERPAQRVRGGDLSGGPHTHNEPGCAFFPDKSSEDNDRRDTVTVTGTLVTPRKADVTAIDKVRIPGYAQAFDIVGEPEWDHESYLSGRDFGLKWYQVKGVF